MKRLFYIFLTLFILSGCSNGETSRLMDCATDSLSSNSRYALHTLDSINRNRLYTNRQKARFALLYTDAQVKCRQPIKDDSLIRFALDYYNRKGSAMERLDANLLMAVVYRNRGNYTGAMYYLTCGEELVPMVDNDFACGRLYGQQGVLYELYENMPKALETSRKSYEYYNRAGEPLHGHFALYRMSRAYISMGEYDKAESLLLHSLNWALAERPKWDCSHFLTVLLHLYELSSQGEKLLSLLDSDYMQLGNNSSLHFDLAKAYGSALLGDKAQTQAYIDSAWEKSQNLDDSMFVNLRLYEIAKIRGDYYSSLGSYLKYSDLRYESLTETIESPLIESQLDYYKHSSQLSAERAKRNAQLIYMLLIIVAIVALCSYIYLRGWYRQRQQEALELVSELEHQSQELQLRCNSMDESIRAQSSEIYNLFREKFQLIDKLSDELFAMTSTQTTEGVILKHINSTLEKIKSSDSESSELERRVNILHNNILLRVRCDMPDLGEEGCKLISYILSGFTSGAICYFMGFRNKQTLYRTKSRLVEKVKRYNNELSQELLSLLG